MGLAEVLAEVGAKGSGVAEKGSNCQQFWRSPRLERLTCMTDTRNLQDYFDEVSDVYFFSDLSKAEKDEKIVALKSEYFRQFPIKNSDYYYFLGYAGYVAQDLGKETEAYFQKSLRLNAKNDFCQYYYAYFLFDSRRYKEALKVLEDIDLTNFETSGITWRTFKINEAMVCCSLFLDGYSEGDRIKKIDIFLTEYEEHVMIEENKYDHPINYPHEIIKTLSEKLGDLSSAFNPVVAKLIRLIEKEDLHTAYSDEYGRFKNFLNLSVPEAKN